MQDFKLVFAILILACNVFSTLGTLLPKAPDCGYVADSDRIIGGEDAPLDGYPWLALIEYKRDGAIDTDKSKPNFQCGGSLINERYVITAAHCITSRSEAISVRLGEHTISTPIDCKMTDGEEVCNEEPLQNIPIKRVIVHEKYVPNVRRKDHRGGQNDIALIELQEPAEMHFFVSPVCLPTEENLKLVKRTTNMETVLVAGWGVNESGNFSDVKQVLKVPLVDGKKCDTNFPTRIISLAQICAGGIQGKDACNGDSGGPLMKQMLAVPPFMSLIGIVSYGPKCSTDPNIPARPSVYVDVAKYMDWIVSNIK